MDKQTVVPSDNRILFSTKKKRTRLLLLMLSPETQPDMGLEDEERMLGPESPGKRKRGRN